MGPEPFGKTCALRQFEDARIVNNPGAYITAAQRNDPAPPTEAHEVVSRPVPARPAGVRVIAEFFPPLIAVPIFYAGEPRPDRVDGMLQVWVKVAKLSSENGGPAAGVHEPAGAHPIGLVGHIGPISFELDGVYFCRPRQLTPRFDRHLQHVLVERAAIDLEGGQPRLIFRA